jgi:hypothetical protein
LLTGADVRPGEMPPTQDPHFITDDSGGAIAFAGYFYKALDWSIATTNANLLMVSAYAPVTGDLVQADFVVEVTIDQQPDVIVSANGATATNGPALTGAINDLYMDWQNGSFIALEISHP